MLPDDVLLEIFDFYVNKDKDGYFKKEIEKWQRLVHVCHRWRSVVFGSSRRLNLRLVCTSDTPARDTLDILPFLPLLIAADGRRTESMDDIIAVLERSDRVVKIEFSSVNDSGENLGMESVLPDSFLGGSAPRLEYLWLNRIPFPGLPKLLLSATHLVDLHLWDITHSGYIPPEAMVTVLSMLTSLERLSLQFKSPRSRPDWARRRLPPPSRSVLPVLTSISFKGVCEYLEDIMTCINAPQLDHLYIILFNQIIFDMPQFTQFISRSPTLETFEKALVVFGYGAAWVKLSPQTSGLVLLRLKPVVSKKSI